MKKKFNFKRWLYVTAYLCGIACFLLAKNFNELIDWTVWERSAVLLVGAHVFGVVAASITELQRSFKIIRTFEFYVLLTGFITLLGTSLVVLIGNFVLFLVTGLYHTFLIKGSELFPAPSEVETDERLKRKYANVETDKYVLTFLFDVLACFMLFM